MGVIAVVGACRPERQHHTVELARRTGRALVPAAELTDHADPLHHAVRLASWADAGAGVVVEVPDVAPPTELVGTFADAEGGTRLEGLVCVVDAAHLVAELDRDDYLPPRDNDAAPLARAQLTVGQIELASTLVLVGWESLPSGELAVVRALLSHLSPLAQLHLHRRPSPPVATTEPYAVAQARPGWVSLLNGDFDPQQTDPGVSAFRYEQVRPLHPGRLMAVLDRIEGGELGVLVRSIGFCRLATRPHVTAQWEHVGRMFALTPLTRDDRLADDEELLAIGQDIALVGLRLDREGLTAALDGAALTDEELAAGPLSWAALPDPFPRWEQVSDHAD
ncbi:GTP-binding protein [Arsenicicoccus dermatophilus]|uniref:GTP-binding protein n=1 Tax=Arsenicicoccus dermatophilus TaxID=1076331 RepID=UPI001F4CEF05|nr:GTP-binding protein [Arsenicicoccus dermatophilus]